MTRFFTMEPPDVLREHVRFFWVLESTASEKEPYLHRSMADGCTEFLFHYQGVFDELKGDRLDPSFTSGIHSHTPNHRTFRITQNFGIFGVYMYPFALQRFFGIPACELTGLVPDLHSVLGKKGKELEEQMMLATDHQDRYRILSSFLENQLVRNSKDFHPVQLAVHQVIHSKGSCKVRDLANRYNLSERQFERKFREYSGFSPKKYSRIIRFTHACKYYGDLPGTLTDIAFQCGYYDQSHFIKDFKKFSGYHPRQYFSGNAKGIEWRDA